MDIKVKFIPGDKAFMLHHNKVRQVRVDYGNVHISASGGRKPDIEIKYSVTTVDGGEEKNLHNVRDEEVFETKEQLKAAL